MRYLPICDFQRNITKNANIAPAYTLLKNTNFTLACLPPQNRNNLLTTNSAQLLMSAYILPLCFLILSLPAVAAQKLIPQNPAYRVIVDNDFAGDPDGLAALAHQLLAPKTTVPLITVTGTDPYLARLTHGNKDTALIGKSRAEHLLTLLGTEGPAVAAGHDYIQREKHNKPSDAAKAIVAEAMKDSPLPLLFTCGGPLTNLAEALKLEPAIADKMTVIWIGGADYPSGGPEYNLSTDLAAAKYVLEQSGVPVWQIPVSTYRQMQYSVAEMQADFLPVSPVSKWLYSLYTDLPAFVQLGGTLTMGDHPLVLLSALSTESSHFKTLPARTISADGHYGDEIAGRQIRVFSGVDARLTFADFIARLKIAATDN